MRFTYLWPWWAVVFGLAVMAGATVYAYLRLKRPLSHRLRTLLISLRILAASVLLLCLLEPVLIEKKDITPPTHLLVLADTSQSMQLEDIASADGQETRLNLVNRLLFEPTSQFLAALASRFEVHLYRFDTQPYQISSEIGALEATGGLTDITTSIRDAAKEWRGQPLAGVVIITDGAHNASSGVVEKVAEAQIPIYTVGVGSPHPPKDLQISKIRVSPVVYMEHDVPIRVSIHHVGYAGSKVRVSLTQNEQIVDAIPITLTDAPTQVIEFTLNPQAEGIFQYVVSLPTLPDELTPENNEKAFPLKVVKTKLRVLYIDSRPRWEYTFLKRALERDPNIDSTCTILSSRTPNQLRNTLLARSNRYYPQTTDLNRIPRFPETLDGLLFYDVLIIGDLRAGMLTPEQHKAVLDFVEKRGKAVIFLGGQNSLGRNGFKSTPLANLLPIVIPPNGCVVRNEDFSPELTRHGMYHPITRLGDTQAKVEALWRDLPPLSRWLGGFQLRGGATVLAEYRADRSEIAIPIIVFQRSGLGKSLLITAEGLWNWAFGVWNFKDEDNTYPRFWGQTVRWMATRADAKQINVTTDLTTYSVGDEVQITAYAYTESYQPMADADLTIEVIPPDQKRFQIRTQADSQVAGAYTAQFRANQKGVYQIRALGADHLSSLGEDSTEVFVQSPLAELENPQLNEALLKALAVKTGGHYTPIAEAASLPEKIKDVRERVFAVQERDLWDNPIVLILAVGFLGVEWFLRKRRGLV
ncbi:MAG: hypothetical protein O7E52_00305 [Candidatus Poribacteria bacterium]|nr:hypothetical protein [Candidatus Poribacteria bacterium]